ncbi:MAG: hypothetical protein HY708_06910 [Ignavibacteriae bacterium]|nr:hypothetical protein [Ignavibacteriota bacterium]
MAKTIRRKETRRKSAREEALPLKRENFRIIGVGILVILAGYAAMLAGGTVEGFLPLVVAPLLLVIGYCVIIPLGILYKKTYIRPEEPKPGQQPG